MKEKKQEAFINVRVNVELKNKYAQTAEQQGMSLVGYVRWLLSLGIKAEQKSE